MSLTNLPGVIVQTIDGNLTARNTPKTQATLVIGTAAQGPADQPVQVVAPEDAVATFGSTGSLIQGMHEAYAGGCDNIVLFRMGTAAATLTKVGTSTSVTTPYDGFSITFGQRTSDVATRYKIWYKNGVLAIYLDGNKVYDNDPLSALDSGDCIVTGSSAGGTQIGTSTKSLANAISPTAAAALASTTDYPSPVFAAAVTGIGMTGRQTYVALDKALDLLDMVAVSQVYCPDVKIDDPNVAYFVSGLPETKVNDPSTNPDALDWLKIDVNVDGSKTYTWASETSDSNGTVVVPQTFANVAARGTAGFFEVNAAHRLGCFCELQQELHDGCLAFIGTKGPRDFGLVSTRAWVGALPVYDSVTGAPTTAGRGILGIPVLVGTPASKLNPLCKDYAGGSRLRGLYLTDNNCYDGSIQFDVKKNKIDVGAYIHVVADYAMLSNGFSSNYVGNIAGHVAGMVSAMDQKQSPTNKAVTVGQLWRANSAQLDSLTFACISVLKPRNYDLQPALLHGKTAANPVSDWLSVMRMRIKFLVVSILRQEADKFIGVGTTDGLTLSGLRTALDNRVAELTKRGYISYADYSVTTTAVQQRIGEANIDVAFTPADELVRLNASISVVRR